MKIYAIKDETDSSQQTLAWLIYYENAKRFYIELPDDADPWETPLLLSSFLERLMHIGVQCGLTNVLFLLTGKILARF